jgi:4-hydroxy-2-oxoheptanedioate aldolase
MLPSVEAARLMAQLPLDWMLIDAEHAPMDDLTLARIVGALADRGGPAPVVRVPENSIGAIKRALDAGAWGVVVPMVNTQAEAEAAVRAAKFPPLGERSFGSPFAPLGFNTTNPEYLAQANDETLLIVQIESQAGVKNIKKILGVDGVDMIFIGPADLTISLGKTLDFGKSDPDAEKAIKKVLDEARKKGIPAGIYCPDGAAAKRRIEQGFQLVNVSADVAALLGGIRINLEASR